MKRKPKLAHKVMVWHVFWPNISQNCNQERRRVLRNWPRCEVVGTIFNVCFFPDISLLCLSFLRSLPSVWAVSVTVGRVNNQAWPAFRMGSLNSLLSLFRDLNLCCGVACAFIFTFLFTTLDMMQIRKTQPRWTLMNTRRGNWFYYVWRSGKHGNCFSFSSFF